MLAKIYLDARRYVSDQELRDPHAKRRVEAAQAQLDAARVELLLALARGMGLAIIETGFYANGETIPQDGTIRCWVIAGQHRELARLVFDADNGGYGLSTYNVQVPPDADGAVDWSAFWKEQCGIFIDFRVISPNQVAWEYDLPAAAAAS